MSITINKKTNGLMLIELMISVTLSVLLISLLLEIYLSYQRNDDLQKMLNIIQHQAKTTINIFRTEIHRAGYVGCPRLTAGLPVVQYPPYYLTSNNRISFNQSEFTVEYSAFPTVVLLENMKNKSTLKVDNTVIYHPGDVLIISSCYRIELFLVAFVVAEYGAQKLTTLHPLHDLYEKDAEVSRMVKNRYYVAKCRKSCAGYSLYLEDITHRKTELIEGISQLFIAPAYDGKHRLAGLDIHFDVSAAYLHKTWQTYIALRGVDDAKNV